MTYRYGQYHDGPDPLAPPYDARLALDELGDAVLGGSDPASALRDLIRRGMQGQRGLDDMLRRVRERQQEVRRAALTGEQHPVTRICDLPSTVSTLRGAPPRRRRIRRRRSRTGPRRRNGNRSRARPAPAG